MKNIIGLALVLSLSWLTWNIWFPTETINTQVDVRAWLPERPEIEGVKQEKWRVLTRRMVWKKAVETFQDRLDEIQIEALVLKRKELVSLHVFDDPRQFDTYKKAAKEQQAWGIGDVDVLKNKDGSYMLGLGRFFLPAYAQQRQEKLEKLGKPYLYKQRTKLIPTYRFIFPALAESEAELLWKSVQKMGAVDPMMMSESEFNATFVGNVSAQ
ncbi:MAG: hypothetical protein R8M45_02145 [Ghiorsea sp.]